MVYSSSSEFENIIVKTLKTEKIEDFLLNVGEIIGKILASGNSKSGSWRYLKAEV